MEVPAVVPSSTSLAKDGAWDSIELLQLPALPDSVWGLSPASQRPCLYKIFTV